MKAHHPPEQNSAAEVATRALITALHENGHTKYQVTATLNTDENGQLLGAKVAVAVEEVESLTDEAFPNSEGLSGVMVIFSEEEGCLEF